MKTHINIKKTAIVTGTIKRCIKRTAIALGITSAMLISPSMAEQKGTTWAGGFAEYYYADKDKFVVPKDRSDWGGGAEVGHRYSDEWAARIEVARIDLEAYPGQDDIAGYRFGVDALYYPWKSQAYVFGGLKKEQLDQGYGLINLGLGRHWEINDKWKVISEVAAYHDFGQSFKDFSAKVGFAYYFGGSSKSRHKEKYKEYKGQPSLVDERYTTTKPDPALDKDKDAVLDNVDSCLSTPRGVVVDAKGCALPQDQDGDEIIDSQDKCPDTPKVDKVDRQGCSLFTEFQESISLAVEFANNSSEVANPNYPDLASFAEFLMRYPDTMVEIEGHSSAPGDAGYNLRLSQKRADAVRDLLINKYSIDAGRLTAMGYGETRLLDTANTERAHAKNRRISATLVATTKQKQRR